MNRSISTQTEDLAQENSAIPTVAEQTLPIDNSLMMKNLIKLIMELLKIKSVNLLDDNSLTSLVNESLGTSYECIYMDKKKDDKRSRSSSLESDEISEQAKSVQKKKR